MSLNKVILNGKLPRFDGAYKAGEGDKKSFLAWSISVKRDFKPEGAQYYPEDLLRFKAFGPKADFINNFFKQGDGLVLVGKLQVEDDYEDKDGNQVKGQMVIMVEDVMFAEGTTKSDDSDSSSKSAPKAAPGKPAPGKPAPKAPVGRPGVPGKKKPF